MVLRPFWWRGDADDRGVLAGKIGSHGPHHRFGELGRLPHLQVNVWRVGVKGSGRHLRMPCVRLAGVSLPVPSGLMRSIVREAA